MRYREFKSRIFEINLGLSDRQMRRIRPLVGFEFEMYVDDVNIDDTDNYEPEYEADYSDNPAPRNINDIIEFFNDGDYNSRQEIRNLETRLRNEFQEWASESFDSRWESNKESFVYDYIKDNWDEGDVADLLELDPDSIDGLTRAQVESAADRIIEAGGYRLNNIRKQALDEYMGDSDIEAEWLDEIGLNSMGDVQTDYNIAWPYYSDIGTGYVDNSSFEELALEFMRALGYKSIAISTTYHGSYQRYDQGKNNWYDIGKTKPDDCYTIEPDGSLKRPNGDRKGSMGLEFVSPPITVEQMRRDIDNIKRWGKGRAHTNETTGLHMNVSVPGYNIKKLDPVKLALLIADEHVLDEYGRFATQWGQSYARSAGEKIKRNLNKWSREEVNIAINAASNGLEELAKKVISTSDIKGHYSINPEDNRVEFRGPGGNWLDKPTNSLINTAKRFAIGLASAVNPKADREDYIKKLNQIAKPENIPAEDPLTMFVKYKNGEISRDQLVKQIGQLRVEREIERYTPINAPAPAADDADNDLPKFFQVFNRQYPDQVVGNFSTRGAVGSATANAGFREFLRNRSRSSGLSDPIQNYSYKEVANPAADKKESELIAPETQPDANWAMVRIADQQPVQYFIANTQAEAERMILGSEHIYNVVPVRPRQSSFNYTVRNADRGSQAASIVATSRESAIRQFRQLIGRSRNNYELLDINGRVVTTSAEQSTGTSSTPVPGSSDYEIVNRRSGDIVFSFSADTQQEAWRKFEDWLTNAGYPTDTEDYGWRPQGASGVGRANSIPTFNSPLENDNSEIYGNIPPRAQQQTPGGFTGEWRVIIDGEEVHRFGGVGNVQADANRVGQQWVLNAIRQGQLNPVPGAEIEVVPVMGGSGDRQ